MKRSFLVLALVVMTLFVYHESCGATTMYSDLSAWQAAAGGSAATVDQSLLTESSYVSSLNLVGGGTIDFGNSSLVVYTANSSWMTWPNSYDGHVLWTNGVESVSGTFSAPVQAFGLWMEPNPFSDCSMTMSLSDGSSLTQTVNGYYGAKFFGFAGWDGQGTQVMTLSCAGADFAFSVSPSDRSMAVPEPCTVAFLLFGLAGIAGMGRKLKK